MKSSCRIVAMAFAVSLWVAVCLGLPGGSRSEATAAGLTLAEVCAPDGSASLLFGWQSTGATAVEVWLDVGTDSSWHPGGFTSAGPLGPGTRSYDWRGFVAGATYYVRVGELRSDGGWDTTPAVSFTTFTCGPASVSAYPTGSAATGASFAGTVSSTGYIGDEGTTSATGYGPEMGSWSSTNYVTSTGFSAGSSLSIASVRDSTLPLNPVTYYVQPTTYYVAPNVYYMSSSGGTSTPNGCAVATIPYCGNGGGPTQCKDGTTSGSSGRGTCSYHGGEAG